MSFPPVWPPLCSSFSPGDQTERIRGLLYGESILCKLTPLDRLSADAVMPKGTNKQWAGAKGDWITMVGEQRWELANVYTRC